MHELSIANSILETARRHMPCGTVLRGVTIRAGSMLGIDPTAMQWAWQGCIAGSDAENSSIVVLSSPWRLRCSKCENEFESENIYAPCACGCTQTYPIGGDELLIVSIEVDEPANQNSPVASEVPAGDGS